MLSEVTSAFYFDLHYRTFLPSFFTSSHRHIHASLHSNEHPCVFTSALSCPHILAFFTRCPPALTFSLCLFIIFASSCTDVFLFFHLCVFPSVFLSHLLFPTIALSLCLFIPPSLCPLVLPSFCLSVPQSFSVSFLPSFLHSFFNYLIYFYFTCAAL